MKSRKTAREGLVAFLGAGLPQLKAVYNHLALDMGGLSPVATVESNGTGPATSLDVESRQYALIITLWWEWTGGTTESGLDDLSDDTLDLIDAEPALPTVWTSIRVDNEFSQTGFDEPEPGVVYRFERIRVIVE